MPAWREVLTQKGQHPLQPSPSANGGQGMLPEPGGEPGRQVGAGMHRQGRAGRANPGEERGLAFLPRRID